MISASRLGTFVLKTILTLGAGWLLRPGELHAEEQPAAPAPQTGSQAAATKHSTAAKRTAAKRRAAKRQRASASPMSAELAQAPKQVAQAAPAPAAPAPAAPPAAAPAPAAPPAAAPAPAAPAAPPAAEGAAPAPAAPPAPAEAAPPPAEADAAAPIGDLPADLEPVDPGASAVAEGEEVVVVTVDRREKNVQDYAGSATAFGEQDLGRVGVTNLRDIARATPYVEIGNQEGATEIYIRGVGSNNNTELGDPATATHFNGVYIPRPRGVGSMVFDIQRVEINRGPQGTLRGRNATAGTLDVITNAPEFGKLGASATLQYGNYSQALTQGMLNIPIGDKLALRLATFSEQHEPFFTNAGPIDTLRAGEDANTLAYRASLRWAPTDWLEATIVHDWTEEKGTGFSGANFSEPLQAGLQPDEVEDPRAVWYRGPQGQMELRHWGVSDNITANLGPVNLQHLGSYRRLHYYQHSPGNAGVDFRGKPTPNLDDWSSSWFDQVSNSVVQELRLYAPDTARFRWTVGGFFFKEDQDCFFATTADNTTAFAGVEFTMPNMDSSSYAGYADATFDITDVLRATGGIRFTSEKKHRDGIGYVYVFNNVDSPVRFGTEGFKYAGRDRTDFTAATGTERMNGDTSDFTSGIERYGVRDTIDDAINGGDSDLTLGGSLNEQDGDYEDNFLDFRLGVDADLTPDNLAYAMFSTAHKSGGFNDQVVLPDGSSVEAAYEPESLYSIELGSKNQFMDRKVTVNATVFGYLYKNLQYQSVQQIADTDTSGPDAMIGASAVRFNAAEARILGLEIDGDWKLPAGFDAKVSAALLHAKFTEGKVLDVRQGFGVDDAPEVSITGNYLVRSPVLTVNYGLSQTIETGLGYFDWIVSAQTKTKYYMTPFNGDGKDQNGNPAPLLSDVVPAHTRVDAGIGWTKSEGDIRVEGFVSNLTNVTYMTSIINTPGLNLRFFNPPRQMGVRLSLYL
jgi:iron complex outermembrane receptor protein